MRHLNLFILILLVCFGSYAQSITNKLESYDFDTTLIGNYNLSYKVDDSIQHLYLQKNNKTITELSNVSIGLLHKNLGYVGADFKYFFVLVHSFGSGNPHYIELIKKETGENVINKGAAWIGADTVKGFLLYCQKDVPEHNDKMTLLNIKTGHKKQYFFPKDIFYRNQVLNRIEISKITSKHLIIKYDTEKGMRTKMYNR